VILNERSIWSDPHAVDLVTQPSALNDEPSACDVEIRIEAVGTKKPRVPVIDVRQTAAYRFCGSGKEQSSRSRNRPRGSVIDRRVEREIEWADVDRWIACTVLHYHAAHSVVLNEQGIASEPAGNDCGVLITRGLGRRCKSDDVPVRCIVPVRIDTAIPDALNAADRECGRPDRLSR
jgi:hypothetical protein